MGKQTETHYDTKRRDQHYEARDYMHPCTECGALVPASYPPLCLACYEAQQV